MREHASPDHGTHEEPAACGCDTGASTAPVVAPPRGTAEAMVYRIPTMDCAAEEGEIRHALKDVPGLRSLNFQLGARTIAIDAPSLLVAFSMGQLEKASPSHQVSEKDAPCLRERTAGDGSAVAAQRTRSTSYRSGVSQA